MNWEAASSQILQLSVCRSNPFKGLSIRVPERANIFRVLPMRKDLLGSPDCGVPWFNSTQDRYAILILEITTSAWGRCQKRAPAVGDQACEREARKRHKRPRSRPPGHEFVKTCQAALRPAGDEREKLLSTRSVPHRTVSCEAAQGGRGVLYSILTARSPRHLWPDVSALSRAPLNPDRRWEAPVGFR
jgi:hypothetical protein